MLSYTMPSRVAMPLFVPFFASWAMSCQIVAGVSDKELAPSVGDSDAGSDAGEDGPVDVVEESKVDAPGDVTADVAQDASDGGSLPEPLYPAIPPERADGGGAGEAGPGRVLTFAVRRFFFGSIDPASDARTFEAWRQFGFDVDGFCTTLGESQTDTSGVCQKPDLATPLCQEDGIGCRDNAVGHLIADVLQFSVTDFERTIHSRTMAGDAQTLLIQLRDVGNGANDPYVPAYVYVTAPTDFPPLWNGTDVLPVDEDSVLGAVDAPKYVVETGYIRDHVWVSGDFNESPMVLPIMLLDEVAEVTTETTSLVIQLDDANAVAEHAMFSAVLDIEPLIPLLERGVLEATNCSQSLADLAINGYFLPSRDLASGAPGFVDPSRECDRQSFAALFELAAVQPPVEAVEVAPPDSPCE